MSSRGKGKALPPGKSAGFKSLLVKHPSPSKSRSSDSRSGRQVKSIEDAKVKSGATIKSNPAKSSLGRLKSKGISKGKSAIMPNKSKSLSKGAKGKIVAEARPKSVASEGYKSKGIDLAPVHTSLLKAMPFEKESSASSSCVKDSTPEWSPSPTKCLTTLKTTTVDSDGVDEADLHRERYQRDEAAIAATLASLKQEGFPPMLQQMKFNNRPASPDLTNDPIAKVYNRHLKQQQEPKQKQTSPITKENDAFVPHSSSRPRFIASQKKEKDTKAQCKKNRSK